MYEIGLFQAERRQWEEERQQIQAVSSHQTQEIRRLSAELEIRPEPEEVSRLTQELTSERRRSQSLNQSPELARQPEVPGSRTCLLATINCLQANLRREKERVQALEQALDTFAKEGAASLPRSPLVEEMRTPDCEREASLLASMREVEDEVLGLREELNAEKKKALEAKLDEQSRRTAWRGELSRLEERHAAALADSERLRLELSRTETEPQRDFQAVQSPRKLREILSMFLVHVQEPLAVVRVICAHLCSNCPEVGRVPPPAPSPVSAASGDDAVVAELVRLVELLRFFATAIDEQRSLRTPVRQSEADDGYDGCRRTRPLTASDEAHAVSPQESIRLVARQTSGAAEWVGVAAIDDTVERVGIATAQAVANPKWVSHIDQTTDRMADWLLSKLPP